MIFSILTMLCGILLIFNPFTGAEFITKIIGILILVYAILDVISTITIRNTVKHIHVAIEEGIAEAEVVEEKETPTDSNKKGKKKKDEEDK